MLSISLLSTACRELFYFPNMVSLVLTDCRGQKSVLDIDFGGPAPEVLYMPFRSVVAGPDDVEEELLSSLVPNQIRYERVAQWLDSMGGVAWVEYEEVSQA